MSIRTTCPARNNKWYMNGGGGYNKCIKISGNWVLQNCVGYAYGRFMEIAGKTACNLATSDAETWYLKKDGYARSAYPKVGAVICWRKGKIGRADGCGHVAIVERVNSDGSILISQSGYSAKKFWTQTLKKPYKLAGYTLQGFILNPWVGASKPTTKSKYTGAFPTSYVNRKHGTKENIKRWQSFLKWAGFYTMAIDGSFGNGTYKATVAFQKKAGLKADGSAGNKTIAKAKAYTK